jgi:hypothetical protein
MLSQCILSVHKIVSDVSWENVNLTTTTLAVVVRSLTLAAHPYLVLIGQHVVSTGMNYPNRFERGAMKSSASRLWHILSACCVKRWALQKATWATIIAWKLRSTGYTGNPGGQA